MSKLVQEPPRPPVSGTITQFLATLPSPLTISLVSLAPQIRFVRWLLETLSWKGSWDESWLLLAAWWGVCLGAEAVLRYLLPVFVVVAWWWTTRRAARHAAQPQPATEDTLHRTVADLASIHELWIALPSLCPTPPSAPPQAQVPDAAPVPAHTTLRVLALAYPPYLLLTLTGAVRLRTLLGAAGTLVLLHRAPFAVLVRRALWRSAYVRWAVYWAWARLSGTPLPPTAHPPQSDVAISVTSSKKAPGAAEQSTPGNAIRFLFTVYENQRWWMGLDWTAALLPGERPSWCTRALQPCAPPAAFTLPPPTTVYTPEPSPHKGKTPDNTPTQWTKRTASWSWDEPEWRVVVRRAGAPPARVPRPLPAPPDDTAGAAKILRAAGKFRGASLDLGPGEREADSSAAGKDAKREGGGNGDGGGGEGDGREDEEPASDGDGWVYADNKWEGGGAKGGMGKYTRFRRWTRVAVLRESVARVPAADVPAHARRPGLAVGHAASEPAPSAASDPSSTSAPTLAPLTVPLVSAGHEGKEAGPVRKGSRDAAAAGAGAGATEYAARLTAEPVSPTSATAPAADEGSRLRQRLKAVVSGVGG